MVPSATLAILLTLAAQPELRPVEAGIEDVSPIGTSERHQRTDLRLPTGFDRVYEISSPDGTPRFARVNGAVLAVFDQAWYFDNGAAAVPAGTRFVLADDLARQTEPTRGPAEAPNAVSLRAESAPQPDAVSAATPSIVSNEFYRHERLRHWLGLVLSRD